MATDVDDIAGTLDFYRGDLHPDLAPYVDGSILRHPLVQTIVPCWKQDRKTFLASSVPLGPFIENDLEMPFFDINLPRASVGMDVANYDSRN
ncbi:hypothetical protein HFN89_07035 [Rhizobium laguerreae]|nr:hypothetical protein [Rhizobium laguerreae]